MRSTFTGTHKKHPGCRIHRERKLTEEIRRPIQEAQHPRDRSLEEIKESNMAFQMETLELPVWKGPLSTEHDR